MYNDPHMHMQIARDIHRQRIASATERRLATLAGATRGSDPKPKSAGRWRIIDRITGNATLRRARVIPSTTADDLIGTG